MRTGSSSRFRWRLVLVLAGVVALALGSWRVWFNTPVSSDDDPVVVEDEGTRLRRLAVGTWEDDYQGKRTLTLNDDGTGTMIVELTGWRAVLAAPRLKFDLTWGVKDGRLSKKTVGGEPAGKVQMILKTMGDRVDEPILEVNQERLLLLDKNGKTRYDWRRVRAK